MHLTAFPPTKGGHQCLAALHQPDGKRVPAKAYQVLSFPLRPLSIGCADAAAESDNGSKTHYLAGRNQPLRDASPSLELAHNLREIESTLFQFQRYHPNRLSFRFRKEQVIATRLVGR